MKNSGGLCVCVFVCVVVVVVCVCGGGGGDFCMCVCVWWWWLCVCVCVYMLPDRDDEKSWPQIGSFGRSRYVISVLQNRSPIHLRSTGTTTPPLTLTHTYTPTTVSNYPVCQRQRPPTLPIHRAGLMT